MARNPTNAEFKELISYLPIFSEEGFEPIMEWSGGELLPGGARTFHWPIYREEVREFFSLAGKECWSDFKYAEKNVNALINKPGFIENADLDQLKTILTFCVRGERFCDGHWGSMIRQGVVQRLLVRLVELSSQGQESQ